RASHEEFLIGLTYIKQKMFHQGASTKKPSKEISDLTLGFCLFSFFAAPRAVCGQPSFKTQ
ncbi:MAG: hypothetical protein ACK5P2_12520, partial [Pseudanabaena sp.]